MSATDHPLLRPPAGHDRPGTAVVTGAASGIGRALAHEWADLGFDLVLVDVDGDRLGAVAGELSAPGRTVRAEVLDVADAEAVTDLARRTAADLGPVRVLCNNAGVAVSRPLAESTLAELRWVLDVNLFGVIHGIHAFLPVLAVHGAPAHILNTASGGGLFGTGRYRTAAYTASKHAVVGLSQQLRTELDDGPDPIGVSVLCPGPVATDIFRRSHAHRHPPADRDPWTRQAREIEAHIGGGTDPAVVARQAVEGVLADRFFIVTHRSFRPDVLAREAEVLEAFAHAL